MTFIYTLIFLPFFQVRESRNRASACSTELSHERKKCAKQSILHSRVQKDLADLVSLAMGGGAGGGRQNSNDGKQLKEAVAKMGRKYGQQVGENGGHQVNNNGGGQ